MIKKRIFIALLSALSLFSSPARSEVVLQYFETEWDEIYRRIPEMGEIGYDGIWIPSPCKSPVAGTIKWANVGYSLYDRFDLGDIPQRGALATRYGTRGDLRRMVDNLHGSDIKVYPDIVFNHNGNGPDFRTYPGMKPNDFHVWADASQPGGWKRSPRMSAYDDLSNGYGGTFQQELVSLIDIVTEPDARFTSGGSRFAAEPAPFVRHPGQYDKYPFHAYGSTLPNENVREMLNRWVHWLGGAIDYDGFRLDAGKHVVREFYGGPGETGKFLHEAQWNFDQRRGNSYDGNVPDLYANGVRRRDMLIFNEIFAGSVSFFDYWRQGGNKMRYLDFPAKSALVDVAFNNGNLGVLGSIGANLDPSEGVLFAQSHDQRPPSKLDLAYAWLLTKVGVPVVYFHGNNISWADKDAGRTWVLPGTGNALGDYNGVVSNLVYVHNHFARGREWNRWADGDFYAHERYEDLDGNAQPNTGEGLLIVALNDGGYDQTRTLQTAFPSGTILKDYTGNQSGTVTVNGSGQVTITVPARGGQGFVCYAPHVAEGPASGEAMRFTTGGVAVPTLGWVVPGGRDASAKARLLPRITGTSVDVEIHYTDPRSNSSAVSTGLVKWGQGRNLNAGAADFTGNDLVRGGFEQASYDPGLQAWKLTADLSGVPEGLHTVRGRLFSTVPNSGATFYQTFSKTVYVDRRGPDLTLETPSEGSTVAGETVAVIRNPDRTAGRVEFRVDGGAWADAVPLDRGVWKAALVGLGSGTRTLEVRATEYDLAATPAAINSSTVSSSFSVVSAAHALAINHAENATLSMPFFTTLLTVPAGTLPGEVKLYWDGYEMAGLIFNGTTVSHVFDGRYVSGGVEQRLSGAFTNGKHFFEAVLTKDGQTRRVARTVTFDLYGSSLTDSDGDGLPDDIELPGFTSGQYATRAFPGDGNEDTIPNNGEYWSRTNPLNEDTNYNGQWDGDEDWDNDGVTNLTEVRRGYLDHGNAFYYQIYDAGSKPAASVASTATWSLSQGAGGTNELVITYRPNNGPLSGAGSIEVKIVVDGGTPQYYAMQTPGDGSWTYTHTLVPGSESVDLSFQTPGGGITDASTGWTGIDVNYTPPSFVMDGTVDSADYLVADNGMRIWAAVRGTRLYFATWSSQGGGNDHFLLVSNNFGNPATHPWGKAGRSNFWFAGWPWLAGEGDTGASPYHALNHGGASGRSAMGSVGGVIEGEIDLVEVFGSVPEVLYFAALAYGDNDGAGILSQCPAAWSADNDLTAPELLPVAVASLRDDDLDGSFDCGKPTMRSLVNGSDDDANYGLRRFFLDENAGDTAELTVRFQPHVDPTATVSQVDLITNLNRRDHATIQENRDAVTGSSDTYYRAYPMVFQDGSWTATLTISECGAYRATVRYFVDGHGPYSFTDGAQRRDLAIVVTPKKALSTSMYEVNPGIVEATSDSFAGRSTFRDMWMANQDRPDIVNTGHFTSLGVNMLWLQPIHPIGVDARATDPATSEPYEPGSPYAVRDYWSVSAGLGANHSESGAMAEFQEMVGQFDSAGIGVMMDGTFNHSAPDAVFGQGAETLFPWASGIAGSMIRAVKPQWYSRADNYVLPASTSVEIAVAPDRSDFGKWTDVRDFYFGNYDALVKYASDSHRDEYLLERDRLEPLSADTRDVWEYFAYYPIYWLEKTGHPAGTPRSESYKGIDGLRCDFAQGLPSEFWEYTINRTRSVKWDFLFMAESLDGYREVAGSKRHGVGYRSARHFDILNENIVFYWRDTYFAYPANGPGSAGTPAANTGGTLAAYSNRRQAFEGVVLLNNLTSHDEVFPSNDGYALLNAYAQVAALDGIPMLLYGQEAGAQNDFGTYGFTGISGASRNWARYELNFGKSIPNFKRWNHMSGVWQNRDWTLQGLYGRVNRARRLSPALRSRSDYFLSRVSGGLDADLFAVAKFEEAGVPAARQDVVLAFVNNNYPANSDRSATFQLNATVSGGANWFGIEPGKSYQVVDLLAEDPTGFVWDTPRTGADLIANGIYVRLHQPVGQLGQAQYLRLVDTSVPLDTDGDGLPDAWEKIHSIDPLNPSGEDGAPGDPDRDGMDNLSEQAAGTDPRDPQSRLAVREVLRQADSVRIAWESVQGKRYRIEWSDDLSDWQPVTEGGSPVTITASGANTAHDVATPPVSETAHRFYRVALVIE